MFRRCYRRMERLQDFIQPISSKRPEYDHIAVNFSSFIKQSLSVAQKKKEHTNANRVMQLATKFLFEIILKSLRPKKSIALLMDGVAPLYRTMRMRRMGAKRAEVRSPQYAGAPLALAFEDKMLSMVKMRDYPEVVFSPSRVPGLAEVKFAQWANDLAARGDVTRNDTIGVVGSLDLHIPSLGITPFHNMTAIQLVDSDLRFVNMSDMLHVYNMTNFRSSSQLLARARTDLVLMLLIAEGWGNYDLPPQRWAPIDKLTQAYERIAEDGVFMFEELPGSKFDFRPAVLMQVVNGIEGAGKKVSEPKKSPEVEEYLNLLLHAHTALVTGNQLDYYISVDTLTKNHKDTIGASLDMKKIVAHLMTFTEEDILRAEPNKRPPPSAPLFQLCAAQNPAAIVRTMQELGSMSNEVEGEEFWKTEGTKEVVEMAEGLLKRVSRDHKAFEVMPTHCWVYNELSRDRWNKYFVDLGVLSKALDTRRTKNSEEIDVTASQGANRMLPVAYDPKTGKWDDIDQLPIKYPGAEPCSSFRVLTFNLLVNCHTMQWSPLGKPPLDYASAKRYPAMLDFIRKTDPDVIAFQEFESKPAAEWFYAHPWIKENFVISCAANSQSLSPWGQVILCNKRLVINRISFKNVAAFGGHRSIMPVASIETTKGPFTIHGVHLLAPYHESAVERRRKQEAVLYNFISARNAGNNCIVMGDFNDCEAKPCPMPDELGFQDAWEATGHSADDRSGFTLDGYKNGIAEKIIEVEFFGRPDKIYVRSNDFEPQNFQVLGTKSVNEQLGTTDAPDYLWPSDHYAIACDFVAKS